MSCRKIAIVRPSIDLEMIAVPSKRHIASALVTKGDPSGLRVSPSLILAYCDSGGPVTMPPIVHAAWLLGQRVRRAWL